MQDLTPRVKEEDYETFQVTLEDALYELVKIRFGVRMKSEWLKERILAGQVYIGKKPCRIPGALVYPTSRVWFTFSEPVVGPTVPTISEELRISVVNSIKEAE